MQCLFAKLVLFFVVVALIPTSPALADDAADVKKAAEAVLAAYSAEDADAITRLSLLARPILAVMAAPAAHSIKANLNRLSQPDSTTT